MEILQKTIRNKANEVKTKEKGISFSDEKGISFSDEKGISFSDEKKIDNLFDFPFISKMSTLSESIPTTMINNPINIDDIKEYLIIDLTDEIQELFNKKQIKGGSYENRKSGRKKGTKNKPKNVNKESDNQFDTDTNTNTNTNTTTTTTDKQSDNMDKLGDIESPKLFKNKKLKIKLSKNNKITDDKNNEKNNNENSNNEKNNNEITDKDNEKNNDSPVKEKSKKSKLNIETKIKSEGTTVRQYPQPRRGVKEVRCSSRIANGGQCKRQSRPGTDLCNGHHKHCPYGKVEGPLEGKFLIVPRRRGPKTRNAKEYSLEELDTSLYQQTEMIKINGQHYLIDNCGFLYKNDNNCEIVGRRMSNEIHWYC